MKKKIIYISHPVDGNTKEKLQEIRGIIRHLNNSDAHIVPLVSYYADVVGLDDRIPHERYRGIQNRLAILESGCVDELWLYGDHLTEVMKDEILLACRLKMSIVSHGEYLHCQLQTFLQSKNLPEVQEYIQ